MIDCKHLSKDDSILNCKKNCRSNEKKKNSFRKSHGLIPLLNKGKN